MSLRERYLRHRRHGLHPLPADASQEQRDARAAELRSLGRQRRRKAALRSGLGMLALALVVAALAYWLLMTIGGRDLLLRQIVARLPTGTMLTWKQAKGPVSGPITLHGVHFSMPRQRNPDCVPTPQASCAMGRIVFDAERVTLDPALRPLLGRTLRLDALDIVGATLDLPRSDEPFELPRWPDVLPRIELPLALRADAIRIDRLKVASEGVALVDIRSARGGLDAAPGSLHLEHLAIDSDRGRFTVHGDYLPRENFSSDLRATAVLPAPSGQAPPRLGLVAKGDLSDMYLAIGGRAPSPLRAVLSLRGDPDRPRWQLRANSDALDVGLLGGRGEASTPLAFNLFAEGLGGSANLHGSVQQGDFAATLQPSKLSLEDRVLRLQPLVLDVFGGRVTATGTADLRAADQAAPPGQLPIRLAVNARGLRWQGADGKAMVGGDADFNMTGTPDKWAVEGQARLQRGNERATIDLTGSGGRERMRVAALRASMPQGRLDGSGEFAWSPRLSWTAKATLAGFDPGYLAPDWPGAINGALQTHGVRRDTGSLLAHVEARELGGTLRGRALRGRGTFDIDGDIVAGDVALALGASRIDARGRIAANIDIDAKLAPLQLDDLLPDGRGSVRGRLTLRGPRNTPDVDVDLRGDGMAFGQYRAERFVAKGRLPWRNGNGRLAVNARGLRWQGADGKAMVGGDADFDMTGTPDKWAVEGQARLQRGNERATIDLTGSGGRERMRVAALRASMPQGRLDGSGEFAWSPRLSWTAKATLAGFDPGYLAPDWPGAINGVLKTHGVRRDTGSLLAHVEARDLGGTLRGRALRGRGTFDIDGDIVAGDVALALGASRIDARGRIAANIDIDAKLAPLQLDDLLPDGRGSVRGRLTLRGPRNTPDVDVDLHGDGMAFGQYRAERLVAKGRLPWRNGNGSLSIDAQGLQAGILLTSLQLALHGAVERLQYDATAQGDIGKFALRGDASKQGVRWQGALASLQVDPTKGATWTLQLPAHWSWDGNNGALSRACVLSSAGGTLCTDADWPRRGIDLAGDELPLALVLPYLPERADGRPWAIHGVINLTAQIRPAGNAWRGSATLTSPGGGVRNTARARRDLLGYRDLVLAADFDPQQVSATLDATLDDDGYIKARIATGWDGDAPLDGELRLATDELTWMELLSPDIVEPTGQLDADLRFGGTRAQPQIGGTGHLQAFATELPALGLSLQDGDVRLDAQADGSTRITGRMRSGEGVLAVDGTLGWKDQDTPLVLNVRGDNVLVSNTRQLRAIANPDLLVRYRAGAPLQVSGRVTVPEADIHLERLEMRVSPSPDVVVLDPVDPQRASGGIPLDLDLALVMGEAVKIDGFGLTGTLGGSLRVRQSPGRETRGTGALEIAGRYRAYGQNLQITRGRMVWSNTPVGDPLLDLRAEREVGEVTAGLRVEGRASAPRATVFSDPPKTESEALAYLTLGRPLSSLTGAEAGQLITSRAALNAGTGMLAAQLGTRIGLDDAGVTQSRALGADVLTVGKYLSPRLYVGYGVSLLGTGQVLTLKYLLRKGFDIQIESSTVENRASVNWRKEK